MMRDLTSVASDALLSTCDKSRSQPFYGEESFRAKLRLGHRRDAEFGDLAMSRPNDPLTESEYLDLCSRAGLTARQKEVVEHRLDGWTFEEIGQASGCTKQGAQRVYAQALQKLKATFHVYPFRGLADVYRTETRRRSGIRRFGKLVR